MGECIAFGLASEITDGPCQGPTLDQAVRLMEKAIEDAEKKASKGCPSGCRCEGTATPLGPPSCHTQTRSDGQFCVCSVTVQFVGNCVEKTPPAPPPAGPRKIEARDIRDFFRKVAQLPELPKNPVGPCDMYRMQHGHGFEYPICHGTCATGGTCRVRVRVTKEGVFAECECK